GELRCAHAGHVGVIEHIKGLPDQLQLHALVERHTARQARIQRNSSWEIEGVSTKAGSAVGGRIAVVVQIGIYETGVWMTGLCNENAAHFATSQDRLRRSRQIPRVVQPPDPAQNEALALIVGARTPISSRVRGVSNLPKIVEPRIDREVIRDIINHFSESVGSEKLKVISQSFVRLQDQAVIRRTGGAFEQPDAVEADNGSRKSELLI